MPDIVIHPASRPLIGSVPVPADPRIADRAMLLAALSTGLCKIQFGAMQGRPQPTRRALEALGVAIDQPSPGHLVIHGVGLDGLKPPTGPIDCEESIATMELLTGILAGQRFASCLVGHARLMNHDMAPIAKALRFRGGRIEGKIHPVHVGLETPPLHLGPLPSPHILSQIEYELPPQSPAIKSALLLSGLYADGPTWLVEPLVSYDDTERMLVALGVPIRSVGAMLQLDAEEFSGELPPFEAIVPGDSGCAAFVLAAALLVANSHVVVRHLGLSPTRTGWLELVRDMGGSLVCETKGDMLGVPIGEVHAMRSDLCGLQVGGELLTRSMEEVPILLALAARARGVTMCRIEGEVSEGVRHREGSTGLIDRISAMVEVLRRFGIVCEEGRDGVWVEGRPDLPLDAAVIQSHGDPGMAMTAAVLGLCANGPTRVCNAGCITEKFPRFVGTMRALGAQIEVADEGATR